MRGTVEYFIGVQRAIRVEYAIHAPIVPRDHWYLVPLEDLLIESNGDCGERESVISHRLGLGQCGLVEEA
jgi:hypothetical protein